MKERKKKTPTLKNGSFVLVQKPYKHELFRLLLRHSAALGDCGWEYICFTMRTPWSRIIWRMEGPFKL